MCVCVCVCVCLSSWQNVVLEIPVVGTTMEAGVYMSAARLCHWDSMTTVQDAVTKLYRCVVDMKMKATFQNG